MNDLIYKIKELFRKLLPLVVMGALLYGGYHLYKRGTFRHGLRSGISSVMRHVPFFGSRFRSYSAPRASHYASRGKRHRSRHRHSGHHRRHRRHR